MKQLLSCLLSPAFCSRYPQRYGRMFLWVSGTEGLLYTRIGEARELLVGKTARRERPGWKPDRRVWEILIIIGTFTIAFSIKDIPTRNLRSKIFSWSFWKKYYFTLILAPWQKYSSNLSIIVFESTGQNFMIAIALQLKGQHKKFDGINFQQSCFDVGRIVTKA